MGGGIAQYVFLDTNVLINDFFYRKRQKESGKLAHLAVQFLKSKPKVTLHVASFSLVQLISTLDRSKVTPIEIADEISRILSRFKLVDLSAKDFTDALKITHKDTEDALQYTLCRKVRCFYLVTDNIKDFKDFRLIAPIKPKAVRSMLF